MVGCCKFGPCRKKRTYEFNNPPYTENKDDGVYHSHKQKLTGNQDGAVKNGSAGMSRTNPAFEGGAADNVEFNEAAVVDLDSECNSIAEDSGAVARKNSKHKENAEGFKSADLVVGSGGVKRKDSKRSSKSSHSSSSSSSKDSKRRSKHSDVVKVNDEEDKQSERVEIVETVTTIDDIHTDVSGVDSHVVTTETLIEEVEGGAVAYPEGEGHEYDISSNEVVVVKREEITKITEDGEVTRVEITKGIITNDEDKTPERRKSDSSHSSKSSSSSDANSYRPNEEEPSANVDENIEKEAKEEEEQAAAAGSGSSDDNSSGVIEAPPGIEELYNAANDMVQDGSYTVTQVTEEVQDGSYTVTQVTEEVSVYAHGDEEEHGETGSEDL